jgi:hypothetical protein
VVKSHGKLPNLDALGRAESKIRFCLLSINIKTMLGATQGLSNIYSVSQTPEGVLMTVNFQIEAALPSMWLVH